MRANLSQRRTVVAAVLLPLLGLLAVSCGPAVVPNAELSNQTTPLPDSAAPPGIPFAPPVTAAAPQQCTQTASCHEDFTLSSGSKVEMYRNYPLDGGAGLTDALVVIHGDGRNPVSTLTGMAKAAQAAGADGHTLIVAPFFKTDSDDPSGGEAVWKSDDWKDGNDSVKPSGLSSFTVVDELLTRLADKSKFPNLNRITVVGHSAGGQFTQRYAAAGQAPSRLPGVAVDYVVANPSSYLYFTPDRPDLTDPTGTRTVRPTGSCDEYNDYKYGLLKKPAYLNAIPDQQLLATYLSRRVTLLLGEADTGKDELDQDCGAKIEGKNRFDRGTRYFNLMHTAFPNAPHAKVTVPGIAHDHYALFESAQAKPLLFPNAAQ